MNLPELLNDRLNYYMKEYINKHKEGDVNHNILVLSELQLNLAQELKSISSSIEHEQLIKDLNREFIDFSTNY